MAHECITNCVDLNIDTYSTGDVEGDGVFDKMMRSTREHLIREHNAGRITGQDFAAVYTAAMEQTMVQAMQFTLQKEAIAADISYKSRQSVLTEEQTNKVLAEIALLEEQLRVLEKTQDFRLLR